MKIQQVAVSASVPDTHSVSVQPGLAGNWIVTIKQAAQLRPSFSEASFRDLKFKAHDRKNSRGETIKGNGTGPAGVWVQVGGKVLVDLAAFDCWLDSHRIGRAA